MKPLLSAVFALLLLLGQPVNAAEPLLLSDVTGLVQQWRPDSTTITVSGRTYEITSNTVFMNGASKPINRSVLRSGSRVMLMVANNRVTHVIVDPIQPSPFDRPNR